MDPILTGLREGSPASNALFTWLLRDLASIAPDGCFIGIYADNIAVACPTADLRTQVGNLLVSYMADRPAGRLELVCVPADLRAGFEFLGYRLFSENDGEASRITPCDGHADAIEREALRVAEVYARNILDKPAFASQLAQELTAHLPATDRAYRDMIGTMVRLNGL